MLRAADPIEIPAPSDLRIALGAWAVASACLVARIDPATSAAVVLMTPVLAFGALGLRPGRGGVVATVVAALALGMGDRPEPMPTVALVGLLDLVAVLGARLAHRMTPPLASGVEVHRGLVVESTYVGIGIVRPARPAMAVVRSRPALRPVGRPA